jgi:hypothetical protein
MRYAILAMLLSVQACPPPEPTPPPVSTTSTTTTITIPVTTTSTLPAAQCPVEGVGWFFDLKVHGGQQLDLTPYVTNPTHTQDQPWVGCGVNRCALSCERGPVACFCQKLLFGNPIWHTDGGDCNVFPPDPKSTMTVKVASGSCLLSVQGTTGTPFSQQWKVSATIPACTPNAVGVCQ